MIPIYGTFQKHFFLARMGAPKFISTQTNATEFLTFGYTIETFQSALMAYACCIPHDTFLSCLH